METDKICPNCRKPLSPGVPLGLCPECLIKAGFPTEAPSDVAAAVRNFVPPPVEQIAQLFPQFEIIGFVGKGGMGAVYKARQPALDRFIALKVLPPAVASDPGFAERFNREARALARLSHPNIVVVYDFGKAGDLHYLVMEFVDGANLREVERSGKLSPDQALAIVPQICEALQFAHNEGIVHRDIKPENLLVDKKGRVKITDFGIAKMIDVGGEKVALTGARDIVGTPHYMAPEQIEKPQTVDHRADIYSLGVVFYEMLTGELPLGKFAPPSKKVKVDVRLDEVVLHTLEKEPERRYQQASQIKTDVETIATGAPPPIAGAAAAVSSPALPPREATSDKIILPAFLLAFFFGVFGAHRFYVGKIGTGLLQLFTIGGLGIWATIDWILILCKVFTDKQGRRLVNWWHPALPKPPRPVAGMSSAMIMAPAVALLIAGILKLFSGLLVIFFGREDLGLLNVILPHLELAPSHSHSVIGIIAVFFTVVPALVMIFGAVEMTLRRSHAWAVVAAVVGIVFCSFVGTPAGIWALLVLLRPNVREAFNRRTSDSVTALWLWILGAVAAGGCLLVLLMSVYTFVGKHLASAAALPIVTVKQAQPAPPALPPPAAAFAVPAVPPGPSPLSTAQVKALEGQLADARAEITRIESQFNTALTNTAQATLAREQQQLADAQRRLDQEMSSFTNGVRTTQTYQDELNSLKNAVGQLRADQSVLQQVNSSTRPVAGAPGLTANATPAVPLTYQWYYNGTNLSSEASDALETAVATVVSDVSNMAGQVSYTPAPATALQVAGESNASFTVQSSGTSPLAYQWTMNGTNPPGASSSSGLTFGPLVARTMTSGTVEPYGFIFINFARSDFVPSQISIEINPILDPQILSRIADWTQNQGADVAIHFHGTNWDLIPSTKTFLCTPLSYRAGDEDDFERFTPADVFSIFRYAQSSSDNQKTNTASPVRARKTTPAARPPSFPDYQQTRGSFSAYPVTVNYVFQTADGRLGALQIAGLTNGVAFRYKLLQGRPAALATAVPVHEDPTNPPVETPVLTHAGSRLISAPSDESIDVGSAADFTKSFIMAPKGRLVMNLDRGDVDIESAAQSVVQIRVERRVTHADVRAAARILQEEHLVFERNGDNVFIRSQTPPSLQDLAGGWNPPELRVTYHLIVPERFSAEAQTSGGNIRVSGLSANVRIKTAGGRLDCSDLRGDVDAETMGGDVSASRCSGALQLQTMGGNITVSSFAGPSLRAATEGGSVSADFAAAPSADCGLHTSGGNVTVRLPENAAVTFDARTDGGEIRTDFPVTVQHEFASDRLSEALNGGGPLVKMQTEGGNIEIEKNRRLDPPGNPKGD